MATYTAIHLETENAPETMRRLSEFLQSTHGAKRVTTRKEETLDAIYGDDFMNSPDDPPTIFAIASEHPSWLTVHYNSFNDCRQLLANLSRTLNCLVVLVMAQSVSSAYHMTAFCSGQHLRTLEFADGSWLRQEGKPLPFETCPLGRNIGSAAEPLHVFEEDSVKEYCAQLGLKLWDDRGPSEWTVLSVA